MNYICDICSSPISKVRYRCVVCPGEFDLCQACHISPIPCDPPHLSSHSVIEYPATDYTEVAHDFYRDKLIDVTIGSRGYERMLDRIERLFSREGRTIWLLIVNDLVIGKDHNVKREDRDKQIRSMFSGKVNMCIEGAYCA